MKKLILSLLLLLNLGFETTNCFSQLHWAFRRGSSGYDYGNAITTDDSGNNYITGNFSGTVDFDPSTNVANLISAGSDDIFIAKYNSAGSYQWAISIGSTNSDRGNAIKTDTAGNVYVTGYFNGTIDVDPSANTANLTSAGNYDIFIAKYNSAGAYQWAINAGGASNEEGNSVSIDALGNIYITGYFNGTADFDPSANAANLTATSNDIFAAKYNSTGNYQWAFNINAAGIYDSGNGIAVDSTGNVYITGDFEGTADFDPSSNTSNITSTSSDDIFVAKYNSAGSYQWALDVPGSSTGQGIALDDTGNVYLTGRGSNTILVAKYNSAGISKWSFSLANTGGGEGNGIALDSTGNVYVTGYFYGTTDFDPSTNTVSLTDLGLSYNAFVAKYSSAGSYQWAFGIGSTNSYSPEPVYGYGITMDNSDNIYVCGSINGTMDFDPSSTTVNLSTAGSSDIFVAKYNSSGLACTTPTITANSTILSSSSSTGNQWYLNGTLISGATAQTYTVTQSGVYSVCVTDANSCSSCSTPYNFSATGIEESQYIQNINIFPNPANGVFNVEVMNGFQINNIEIYSVMGENIYSNQTLPLTIDLSSQPNGVYFIQMKSGEEIFTEKIVIQKP